MKIGSAIQFTFKFTFKFNSTRDRTAGVIVLLLRACERPRANPAAQLTGQRAGRPRDAGRHLQHCTACARDRSDTSAPPSAVTPVPKPGGRPGREDDHKGIAVGPALGKLYVLLSRLDRWADGSGLRARGQAFLLSSPHPTPSSN
jgi:hypothetical protein